ncbi:serine/threonine-protein kinase [Sorangium sp. So ce185]|uniref:serine/threonine protein kinase n=1 Tax=Sorangium sp. So ce185 TaxID=3133287 RepID=UPI003F637A0B
MNARTLNGRYLLGSLLGEGGMGAVYEAEDLAEKRRVAVKLINPERAERSGSAIGRFEREARVAGGIDTDHIARVLDSGKDAESGAPFMVIELLRGEDLGQLLGRLGPLPPPLALRIVAQTCVGLQKAHEAGVMHRDIKPANLFLARREGEPTITVKLLDFGIAKIRRPHGSEDPSTGLTQTGTMLGTPRYMSPEQARGRREMDHRTDIWSLGIVLYRALAGRTPHEHIEAFVELIAALVQEPPPPVQDFAPWVSPEISRIVHTALQHDRERRYPSAAAMLKAILPLLDGDLTIDESMLVPLTETERAMVADRPDIATTIGVTARDVNTTTLTSSNTIPEPPAAAAAPQPNGLAWRRIWHAAGISVLLAGSLGAYTVVRAVNGFAQGGASQAPPQATTEQPAPRRRVNLVVLPADASVEIDGRPATMRDGILELEGELGSMRRVRVFKGEVEIVADVAVTELGAHPTKLELPQAPRKDGTEDASTAPSLASTSAAAPNGSSPRKRAPQFSPLVPKKFE